VKIEDSGSGNEFLFDPDAFAPGADLRVRGDDNTIAIGDDVDLRAPMIHIQGNGNVIRLATEPIDVAPPETGREGPFILHVSEREAQIIVLGDANRIESGHHVELYDSKLQIVGNDNVMRFGHRARGHFRIDFHTSGALFDVGDQTTCVSMHGSLHEPRALRLGKDCQIAADIYATVSDTHSISDLRTGERINPGQDVVIGDHVWLCYRAVILKGSTIGSGSVVGTCAVVAGDIGENSLAVGNPARVVRENIAWDRDLPAVEAVEPVHSP